MSTPGRVAAFAMVLAIAFLGARAVGALVGPVADEPATMAHDADAETGPHDGTPAHDDGQHEDADAAAPAEAAGLSVSQGGLTLRLGDAVRPAGDRVPVSFTVEGAGGQPVTDYAVEHEKRLHLVAVRRDLTGYQHVHPELSPDGTWTTRLDLRPGSWRLVADFRPTGGEGTVLGADLSVPGEHRPAGPSALRTTAPVDGYRVSLDGDLTAGRTSPVTLAVAREGRPVTDLQPHLGARGHLVALREGDLGYLHVHPEHAESAGPEVGFAVEVPTEGRYRLYFEFRHEGRVRTAELAVDVPAAGAARTRSASDEEGSHDH